MPAFSFAQIFLFTFFLCEIILVTMNLHRFYCKHITQPTAELLGPEAHHLTSVRRMAKGDIVELFDGAGTLATAKIIDTGKKKVTLEIEDSEVFPKTQQPEIIIAPSIAKGERFDWLIAKCTELGVDRITPVIFERTVKQPKNPKIIDRWNNIAISSAKQCKRLFLPRIDAPCVVTTALDNLKADYPDLEIFLGCPQPQCPALVELPKSAANIIALIGPEGGITKQEKTQFEGRGAKPVRLTSTVLRVETAALTFAAILIAQRDAVADNSQ